MQKLVLHKRQRIYQLVMCFLQVASLLFDVCELYNALQRGAVYGQVSVAGKSRVTAQCVFLRNVEIPCVQCNAGDHSENIKWLVGLVRNYIQH